MCDETVYEISNLRKIYRGGVLANEDLSLTIRRGEIFGILGPNGAGKTTLVRQMVGLLKPTQGTISLDGNEITRDASRVARSVAFLPQTPIALFDLTVREAILYTGRLRGMDRRVATAATDRLLMDFDLLPSQNILLERLSGGQLRLAGISTALIGDLPILVLDEPTNDLDPVNRRRVWERLLLLRQQRGTTVILVTHNVLEAERILDRVAVIDHGRLIALGSPGELKRAVDGRVRLEFSFREGAEAAAAVLEGYGALATGERRWTLLSQREQVASLAAEILSGGRLEDLDDFRILTPSLEDVYLRLSQSADAGQSAFAD